jgi:acyl-coenzyme A thioesterase PaaI-like protein
VDLRIDYLQPGLADKGLVCECSVLRMGNKVAVTRMEIFSEGEHKDPIATGQGVYNVVRRTGS